MLILLDCVYLLFSAQFAIMLFSCFLPCVAVSVAGYHSYFYGTKNYVMAAIKQMKRSHYDTVAANNRILAV
jgi:hypothetical protein